MSWVRLDDDFPNHPKVAKLRPEAGWLWVHSLAWARKHKSTGGVIDDAVLARVAANAGVRQWKVHRASLVAVKLWEDDGDAIRIHDFDAFGGESATSIRGSAPPVPASGLTRTEIAQKAAAARWSGSKTAGAPHASCIQNAFGSDAPDASKPMHRAMHDASGSDASPSRTRTAARAASARVPDPDPDPDPSGGGEEERAGEAPKPESPKPDPVADVFRVVYPVEADELATSLRTCEMVKGRPPSVSLVDVAREAMIQIAPRGERVKDPVGYARTVFVRLLTPGEFAKAKALQSSPANGRHGGDGAPRIDVDHEAAMVRKSFEKKPAIADADDPTLGKPQPLWAGPTGSRKADAKSAAPASPALRLVADAKDPT